MARQPDPTTIVVDTDCLVADLFIDGTAREVMDVIRGHDWLTLKASDYLIEDTVDVIAHLGDRPLADAWNDRFERLASMVEHPAEDHPALASAYAGQAAHLISYDDRLASVRTGLSMRKAMPISVRSPDAFMQVFDPASLFESVFEESYPGPNRAQRD